MGPSKQSEDVKVGGKAAAKTLVGARHDAENSRKKGGRKSAASLERTIDTSVAKCLRDNFSTLTEEQQRVLRRDGETLTERLREDKAQYFADKKEAPAFGKYYYDQLRCRYSMPQTTTAEALEPTEDEEVSPQSYEAVKAARAHVGNRQPLAQYLQTAKAAPNLTEVCGLFAHTLELKPHL